MGIIAGGMQDGSISIWDASKVVKGHQSNEENFPCISMQNIHDGVAVNSIEFNPNKPNLLASGGREVVIQDLSKSI